MSRPSKCVGALNRHATKAEVEQRKAAEQGALSGYPLRESGEVRKNAVAHAEFLRVRRLLAAVGKNDALYEAVINRYCQLRADCAALAEVKQENLKAQQQLERETMEPTAYYRLLSGLQSNYLAVDKQIAAKQKMAFDIEKECAMTVASSLRSIPKTAEKAANPLLEALAE